jgi:hypothetical protein
MGDYTPVQPARREKRWGAGDSINLGLLVVTVIGLMLTMYALFQGNFTRWQDSAIAEQRALASQLYAMESTDTALFCLYDRDAPISCDEAHTTLSDKTIAYASVVADFYATTKSYQASWCNDGNLVVAVFRVAVQDCDRSANYLKQIEADPYGVFRQAFGRAYSEDACEAMDACFAEPASSRLPSPRASPTAAASPEPAPTAAAPTASPSVTAAPIPELRTSPSPTPTRRTRPINPDKANPG